MKAQLKQDQVFGVYQHSDSNTSFTTLSLCTIDNRKEWITTVAETCNIKPIGAWVIRKIKKAS